MKTCILHLSGAIVLCLGAASLSGAEEIGAGYWSAEQAREILDKTRRIHLAHDLSGLSTGEKNAVAKLLLAGRLLNAVYEDSRHPEALDALQVLQMADGDPDHRTALLDLYYLFRGPVATTLDNQRVPFLPVRASEPGKNVYPWALTRETFDPFLEAQPTMRPALLGERTVVRDATRENANRDLETLMRYPVLEGLHASLREELESVRQGTWGHSWYALPYSVRWAPRIMDAHGLLNGAAEDIETEDRDFADYLRLRARDLISDDYEGGDAAWVRGDFGNLNAQIGSYETYDDALYGVKSFFSLSVLARDDEKSRELESVIGGIQEIQDGLPQDSSRKVAERIPVGVYNVIADFGQSRGSNTATILPNDADHSRKYGRTILLRYNIMTHPDLFADTDAIYRAAVAEEHADDLTMEGGFYRTLWHEIGHYLGVAKTADGQNLDAALSPWGSLLEEMKSDLVSLHTAPLLEKKGVIDANTLRAIQASGIYRVLQRVKPRRDQPYQTMQLMQMNYFLENGLLRFNADSGRLGIDYERYSGVVDSMLGEVLAIQASGDPDRAAAFIEQYGDWDDALHGVLAQRLIEATPYRFRMVSYEVLDQQSED